MTFTARCWIAGLCGVALAACSSSMESPGPSPVRGGGTNGAEAGAGEGQVPSRGGANGSGDASGGAGGGTSTPDGAADAGGTSGDAGDVDDGASVIADASVSSDGAPSAPSGEGTASAACGGGAMLPPPDGYQSLMANGKMRKFLVRAPKSYDGKKPLGLIFAFHGGGSNGMAFETRIAAIVQAVGERGIFIYPDELPPPGGGQITWARDYKDDLVFMDAIFDWLKTKVCYDTSRVFSWGQSSGAYFANTVGCHRAGVFRAVASNGGGVRPQEFMACNNRPAAAWISNGAMDPSHLPDAKKARDAWVMINGCTPTSSTKVTPDPCISYAGCKTGFPVHYCENSGGHDIPAYAPAGIADFFFGSFDK